jgi:hypothetical protein
MISIGLAIDDYWGFHDRTAAIEDGLGVVSWGVGRGITKVFERRAAKAVARYAKGVPGRGLKNRHLRSKGLHAAQRWYRKWHHRHHVTDTLYGAVTTAHSVYSEYNDYKTHSRGRWIVGA